MSGSYLEREEGSKLLECLGKVKFITVIRIDQSVNFLHGLKSLLPVVFWLIEAHSGLSVLHSSGQSSARAGRANGWRQVFL